MTVQMIIRIDSELKKKLARLAQLEGKSTSKIVRELVENYINERDIAKYIDELWNRISEKFKVKGIEQKDIERTIKEVRKKKK